MKFGILGHLIDENHLKIIPESWIQKDLIISPEFNIEGTKGHIFGVLLTSHQIMTLPREKVRRIILDSIIYAQDELGIELIQLGALTTSVTSGGIWLKKNKEFKGFLNHGDSYTAAVTCQAVLKSMKFFNKNPEKLNLAVVGAYGIIGEAVSKILVPKFEKSILIGRRERKLKELETKIKGNFETTTDLKTKESDVIVTATSHPTALLNKGHLKKNSIIIDVSIPSNLTYEVCQNRPDIHRIDGGYVDFPQKYNIYPPGVPTGKLLSCMVEVIMQAIENEKENHIGSIDIKHLKKTEEWSEKYGFKLIELTNFGKKL